MEFRSRPEDGVGMPASLSYNPPPIRASAFSKPLLPPSSSLLSPPRVVGEGAGSRNGIGQATNTASSVFDPPIATTTTDHPLRSHVIDPEPAPTVISSPSAASSGGGSLVGGLNSTATKSSTASAEAAPKYRECLRNHAASLGGHVLDGCGEFMPGGDAGTPDALKCAACGCHRSFHRKEIEGDRDYYRFNNGSPSPHHHAGRGRVPLLLPPPPLHHPQPQHHPQYHMHAPSPSGVVPGSSAAVGFGGNYSGSGGATTESSSEEHAGAQPRPPPGAVSRKRFRTKFTAEQKEKMLAFAERVGWRIQKQDEAVVEQFCADLGIRRQVLKVWMHNNKHNIRRQQQQQEQQPQQDLQQQQQQQQQQQHQ